MNAVTYRGPYADVDQLDPAWAGLVDAGCIPPSHPARRNRAWRAPHPSRAEQLEQIAHDLAQAADDARGVWLSLQLRRCHLQSGAASILADVDAVRDALAAASDDLVELARNLRTRGER